MFRPTADRVAGTRSAVDPLADALRHVVARAHTRAVVTRDAVVAKARVRGDAGVESIEVVVLSVVGLAIVIALGAAIKALVGHYQSQLTP